MSTAVPKRKRAGGPRSKTGCATCRQRRVKCGEERPICHACARGKFKCSGYDDRLPSASPSSDTKLSSSPSAMALFPVSTYDIPFAVPGGPADRRALHYFLNYAAPDLAGFIAGGFWESFVPQRCQDEPIVRQALVALSCAHLEYRTSHSSLDGQQQQSVAVSTDTTEAYGKALRKLRRYMESETMPSRAVVLICCSIFYNFELLRGDRSNASHHLDNGIAIIKVWEGEVDRGKDVGNQDEFEVLMTKFARMDTVATLEDIKRAPKLKPRSMDGSVASDSQTSQVWTSAQQAHDHLVRDCIHPLIDFLVRVDHQRTLPGFPSSELFVEKRRLETRIRSWKVSAEAYEWEHFTPLPCKDRARQLAAIGFLTTKAHYYGTQLLLAEALPAEEDPCATESPSSWDSISFKLLKLARTVLDLKRNVQQESSEPRVRSKWSPEPGVVESVLLLANRTKVPKIRREARRLVKEFERLEGLSGLVGKLVEWKGEGQTQEEFPWFANHQTDARMDHVPNPRVEEI